MCVYGSLSAETCQGRGQAVASGEELAWILSSLLLAGSCRVTRAHPDIRPEDLKSSMGSDMQARVPPGPPDHSVLCKFLTLGPSPGWAPQVAPVVRDPPVNAGDLRDCGVWSLGREDPLEKGMATHSNILAWRIPWTEEPGGLQSTGSQESDRTEWLTLSPDLTQVRVWNPGFCLVSGLCQRDSTSFSP